MNVSPIFRTYLYLLGLCLPLTPGCVAQVTNISVEARIDIQQQGELLEYFFAAINKTEIDKSLSYHLKVINYPTLEDYEVLLEEKDFFVLKPSEKRNLRLWRTADTGSERLIVFLLIYQDKQVIGKDRIELVRSQNGDGKLIRRSEPRPKTTDVSAPAEVNLLRGMVVEDTKTKPGRDFYRYFFLEYTNKNINGEKIVKVTEELAIGGNTMIKIYAGQDLVSQFFVNPASAYLQEMAVNSVTRLDYYFRQNRAIRQDLIKY